MMNLGDNYVTGDNIYLRELQNFFFEVLGMMSITHYGAIGDGRTDNYGPLQVAIDDAHRRGLSYLYVPYGRFIYTGELINIDGITFIGNPHSKIINIRTGVEIPVLQFGVGGGTGTTNYNELINKPKINNVELREDKSLTDLGIQGKLTAGNNISIVGDVISATGGGGGGDVSLETVRHTVEGDYSGSIVGGSYIDLSGAVGSTVSLTPIESANTAYFYESIQPGERYDIIGDFTIARLDSQTNEMLYKYEGSASTYAERIYYVPDDEGTFVVSFTNVNTNPPKLYHAGSKYADFTGARSGSNGSSGLVPRPMAGEEDYYLKGDGYWSPISVGNSQDIIGLRLSANFTGSNTNGMAFTTVTNTGTSFSLSSDGIYVTVGTGVNYIEASFGLYFSKSADGATNYNVNLKARRGEDVLFLAKAREKIDTVGDHTIHHASQIIAVQPGDRIYLNSVGFASGDTTTSAVESCYVTYLTIKKVG